MALLFDNATITDALSANVKTLIHTAAEGSVLLVFSQSNEEVSLSAVAAGGIACTRLTVNPFFLGLRQQEIWALTAPAAGALTISAIHSGNAPSIWVLGALTYTGQKTDGSPFGGVAQNSDTAVTTLTLSISTTAGNVVVAMFGTRGNSTQLSAQTGTTRLSADLATTATMHVVELAATGASHVLTATADTILHWGVLGVNLIASAGGAPATINGSATMTDAADTFVASATNRVTGSLGATDVADSFAATGYTLVSGTFTATDTPDTFVAQSGTPATRSATVAATDTPDTFSAPGYVIVAGTFIATDSPDTFDATGTSDSATGSSPPAVVVTVTTDPGAGGGGHSKRKSSKPPYIRAPQDFWDARARYLESLQPEILSEPEQQALLQPVADISPATVSPQLVAYRIERQELITALPLATSMRQLRAAGERLIAVNARIAEQKRLQLAADLQAAAIRKAERLARRKAALRPLKRKAVLLAAAQVALALSHIHRNQ